MKKKIFKKKYIESAFLFRSIKEKPASAGAARTSHTIIKKAADTAAKCIGIGIYIDRYINLI